MTQPLMNRIRRLQSDLGAFFDGKTVEPATVGTLESAIIDLEARIARASTGFRFAPMPDAPVVDRVANVERGTLAILKTLTAHASQPGIEQHLAESGAS